MEKEILKKLGLTKRGAYFILKDKKLCDKIINNDITEIKALSKKHNVPLYYIKQRVLNNEIPYIANGSASKGKKIFIFDDDLFKNGELNYHYYLGRNTISNRLNNIYREFYRSILNEREFNIFDSISNGSTFDSVSNLHELTAQRVNKIYNKCLIKVLNYHRKQKEYDELKAENLRLKTENEYYKNINEQAHKKHIKNNEDLLNNIKYNELGKNIIFANLDASVRLLNCFNSANIYTYNDLRLFLEKNTWRNSSNKNELLKLRRFGRKSITELEDLLEWIHKNNKNLTNKIEL